jgi:hypothetical protein
VTVSTLALDAPAFLQLGDLSPIEDDLRVRLAGQLTRCRKANRRQETYYEGSRMVRDLGIAIPPHLRDLPAVAGWPEIVVDVVDERMDWLSWYTSTDLGLDQIAIANHLPVEVGQAVLESLICGLGFVSVGTGDTGAGEPDVLVKAESPNRVTVTWSSRLSRAVEGLAERTDARGNLIGWTIYTLDETITTERRKGRVAVINRDRHELHRVPIAVIRNRPRASRVDGRSEITRAIRALTESGMRTLLGTEVTREFYSAPQRWLMGADEAMFVGPDGEKRSQWDAVIGHMLSIPRDDDGDIPTAGQFPAQSPEPNVALLRTYAQMISAVSGIPATHLGFVQDNPASADAIREANTRLDKRALRRASQYNLGTDEIGTLSVLWRDGALPAAGAITSRWGDPSTPTPAAAADRLVKFVGAGLLPAESDVALEQAGFSETDIARIKADRRRLQARERIQALAGAAGQARTDPAVAELAARGGAGAPPAIGGGSGGNAG